MGVLGPPLCYIALLVHRAVVVVMVVVVFAVFGAAAVSVAVLVFGREVTRLGGRAQVCAQAWVNKAALRNVSGRLFLLWPLPAYVCMYDCRLSFLHLG